jgi:hypothetical protein
MSTPRRNDPCPCGSGRKYKHCHGTPGRDTAPPDQVAWRRVRRATEGYPSMMMRFIDDVYGPDAIHEAWDEFTLWEDEEEAAEFDPDTPHLQTFMPWFFHRWAPDPQESAVPDPALSDRPPSSVLLERRGRRLDPVLRRYLEACAATPFSFHEVLEGRPGEGLRTRDVFTGAEHDVLDRSASRTLRPGELVFGQIVTAEGIALLEAVGPYAIPPEGKIPLLELRERMGRHGAVSPADLADWDIEIRDAYLTFVQRIESPPLPHLHNTDGEELIPHRLHFEIDSPGHAVEALRGLAEGVSEKELLESADLDAEGRIHRVRFPWTQGGKGRAGVFDRTVLAHLEIDGGRLVVQVNSAERAARIRKIIEDSLGTHVRHRATEIEPLEPALKDRSGTPAADPRRAAPNEPLPPEVVSRIGEMMAAHYEAWVTEEIPALGGLTPLEAVRSPVGREKVEALIAGIAEAGRTMTPPLDPAIIHRLRERLGMSRDG